MLSNIDYKYKFTNIYIKYTKLVSRLSNYIRNCILYDKFK